MTIKENVKRILNNVDAAKAASSYSNQSVSVVAVTKSVEANLAREVFEKWNFNIWQKIGQNFF